MNTYNYLLSDFLQSDIPANYGTDYYVEDKNLITPLSSTWLNNVSSIYVLYKGVSALNLEYATSVKDVFIQDPDLVYYNAPATSMLYLCAVNINTDYLRITGGDMSFYAAVNCPNLKTINLEDIDSINQLLILYNPKLSSLEFSSNSAKSPFSVAFPEKGSVRIDLLYNNLTNDTYNMLYSKIIEGTRYIDQDGLEAVGTYPIGSTLTIYDYVTGNIDYYIPLLVDAGMNVNLNLVSLPPQVGSVVFASKI